MRPPTVALGLMLAWLLWLPAATTETEVAPECVRPSGVQRIVFSAQKYPNARRHFRGALRRGWPRRLVVNRRGADARRERALRDIPTRDGFDRDEYPPAVGRGRGPGLERGRDPRGWKADLRYVPSSENRSHGASLGGQLQPFCNGTRFRYLSTERRRANSLRQRNPASGSESPPEASISAKTARPDLGSRVSLRCRPYSGPTNGIAQGGSCTRR